MVAMTSAGLASHLESAQLEDPGSDLNQVVARAESFILQVVSSRMSVRFALAPSVARVALTAADLQRILIGLCAEVARVDGTTGRRLVVETRGLNDAHLAPVPDSGHAAEVGARLVVRAEQLPQTTLMTSPEPTSSLPAELGLAQIEALLDRLGGRLELIPTLEHGVAHVAHLPYLPPANSSGRMPVALAHGLDVILLVEDEPQVQAVTARILRAFGYSVITAHNERTALAQAEQHGAAIGLVVSDLVLPGVSGTDLVRRLRQPCERARVLFISGYSPEHVATLDAGASFLRKPFTAQEHVTIVRDLLAAAVH